MIDRSHPLPITRQAQIVQISRGSVYYEAEPVSEADLKLMRRIDELHLEVPFAGARMLRDLLRGRRVRGRSQAHDHADAPHGHHGAVPQAEHEQEGAGADDLPVPAAHAGDHAFESRLGDGHQCAMQARFATTKRKEHTTVSEPKLADSRPAAAMLPRTGGGRAKGGCKARPFADGGVPCAEQPELYRARSLTVSRATARSMVRQRSVRRTPLYLADTPSLRRATWRDPVGLDVPFWRVRANALGDGFPPTAIVQSHQG